MAINQPNLAELAMPIISLLLHVCQERRIKADAEEKIKKVEEDVVNVRRMLEMNSNQDDVGEDNSQIPSPGGSNKGDGNEEVVAPLPPGVTPEDLTSVVRDWRRSDENYWRRSLMISGIGAPGDKDSFRAVRERLRAVGLAFLAEDCVSNYVTGRGPSGSPTQWSMMRGGTLSRLARH